MARAAGDDGARGGVGVEGVRKEKDAVKRFWYLSVLAIVSLVAISYRVWIAGGQAPDPRAILDKAIEAHGGAANINKRRMGMLKGKTIGTDSEFTQEETFDLPKRWKRITASAFEGKRRVSTDVMIDGKLWRWEERTEAREIKNDGSIQPYFAALSVLLDLKQKKAKLSELKKVKVKGDSAVGFRASWDSVAADYYFDERTGVLVQSKFTFQPEPGKSFDTETVYSDYKDVDGVKLAHRRTTYVKGGDFETFVLLTDFVVEEVRILQTIPNEVFSVPGKQ